MNDEAITQGHQQELEEEGTGTDGKDWEINAIRERRIDPWELLLI